MSCWRRSSLQAFVTPEQLGELALFLCSDVAAQVRGAAWNMDGELAGAVVNLSPGARNALVVIPPCS